MRNIDGQIAFAMVSVGITCTTLGHYLEAWPISYIVAVMFALISGMVFSYRKD